MIATKVYVYWDFSEAEEVIKDFVRNSISEDLFLSLVDEREFLIIASDEKLLQNAKDWAKGMFEGMVEFEDIHQGWFIKEDTRRRRY